MGDNIGYGVRQVRLTPLLATGGNDPSAVPVTILYPQNFAYDFVYIDGEQITLRGGDDIKALIQEADQFVGADFTLELAEMNPLADECIVGGVASVGTNKWESPVDDTENPYPFKAEIWVANYGESQSNSIQDGYVKYTFGYCTGRRSSGAHADKAFGTQSYSIKARINEADPSNIIPAITYAKVATIV